MYCFLNEGIQIFHIKISLAATNENLSFLLTKEDL